MQSEFSFSIKSVCKVVLFSSVQVVAVVLPTPALCIHKMVFWEPAPPTLTAEYSIPQMHSLRANMIHDFTSDPKLQCKALHGRESQEIS